VDANWLRTAPAEKKKRKAILVSSAEGGGYLPAQKKMLLRIHTSTSEALAHREGRAWHAPRLRKKRNRSAAGAKKDSPDTRRQLVFVEEGGKIACGHRKKTAKKKSRPHMLYPPVNGTGKEKRRGKRLSCAPHRGSRRRKKNLLERLGRKKTLAARRSLLLTERGKKREKEHYLSENERKEGRLCDLSFQSSGPRPSQSPSWRDETGGKRKA